MGLRINFLALQGRRMGLEVSLGTQIRQEYILVRWGHRFYCGDEESHRLTSVIECDCKQSCWMGCADTVCSCNVSWSRRLEAIFYNGWGYKLVSLPECNGEAAIMVVKLFVVLNSNWPMPQIRWLNRSLAMPCKLSILLSLPSARVLQGYIASRCSRQSLWSDEARN